MDTQSVRELIDNELSFFKPWIDCFDCDIWNNIVTIETEFGKDFDCKRDCKSSKYHELDNNFINFLIVYLVNRLSKINSEKVEYSEEITSEEFEILKFLYQIYKDSK